MDYILFDENRVVWVKVSFFLMFYIVLFNIFFKFIYVMCKDIYYVEFNYLIFNFCIWDWMIFES